MHWYIDRVRLARWVIVGGAVLLAGASLWYAGARLQFRNKRSDLLSRKLNYNRRWFQYVRQFGEEKDLVVGVEGRDRDRIVAALDTLASQVRRHPRRFDLETLLYKTDLRHLGPRALLYLPTEAIRSIDTQLDRFKPVLTASLFYPRAMESMTLDRLYEHVEPALGGRLDGPQQEVKPEDFGFLSDVSEALIGVLRGTPYARQPSPWKMSEGLRTLVAKAQQQSGGANPLEHPQYNLAPSGHLGLLLVSPTEGAGGFTGGSAESVRTMRRIIQEVRQQDPNLRFGLTGMPVLETDEMVESQHASIRAAVLSLLGVALLFIVAFRRVAHPLVAVATLLLGMAWSIGFTTLTVGHLNILSISFLSILIGLGINYGIHYVTHYDEARLGGATVGRALSTALANAGPGILTGAISSAIAFYTALMTDFLGMAELGFIAGSGVLLCMIAAMVVLPALLAIVDHSARIRSTPAAGPSDAGDPRSAATGGSRMAAAPGSSLLFHALHKLRGACQPRLHWLMERPGWVLGLTVLGTLALVPFALKVKYDANLLHLQSQGLESVAWEKRVAHGFNRSMLSALAIADSPAEALSLKDRFLTRPMVGSVDTIADMIPADQEAKLPLVAAIHQKLSHLPGRTPRMPPADPAALRAVWRRLAGELAAAAAHASPPTGSAMDALRARIETILARLDRLPAGVQAARLSGFQQDLIADLYHQMKRLESVSAARPITVADVPRPLRVRFVSHDGRHWLVQVFARKDVWDMGPMGRFVADVRSVDPQATGEVLQTYETLSGMERGYEMAAGYALVAIILVLLADFTRPWILVPVVALAALAAGLARLGVPLGLTPITQPLSRLASGLVHAPVTIGARPVVVVGLLLLGVGLAVLASWRGVLDTLLALLPKAMGMLVLFGIMGTFGVNLNPANMIVLPLIVGIGIDYGVHVLHDYRKRPPGQVYQMSRSTTRSLVLCALTTMIGFGTLMIARHWGIISLGLVVTLGIATCLATSLAFLPAALKLRSRHRDGRPASIGEPHLWPRQALRGLPPREAY